MTNLDKQTDSDLRETARKRVQARANSWRFLALWAVLSLFFAALWAVTSPGEYFWPVWPILGVGIGVAFSFYESHGSSWRVSESRIDAELARMRG